MDNKKFGEFISQLRKEKQLTQKEVADKLFVTDKAVSKWERGLSFPDVELLIPIADLYGVSVLELLKGEKLTKEEQNTNETIVKALKNSYILVPKLYIPKWMKRIFCFFALWFLVFNLDCVCVTKFYHRPLFSLQISSNEIKTDASYYTEKKYIGLGYSFYTRGQNKKKDDIIFGEIRLFGSRIKTFFKGVKE